MKWVKATFVAFLALLILPPLLVGLSGEKEPSATIVSILIACIIIAIALFVFLARPRNGYYHFKNGDYDTALEKLLPLAEKGDSKAQTFIGEIYRVGYQSERDDKEAAKWYHLAAKQGSAAAQYNLGDLYYKDEGVKQNYKEAARWWRLAAEQGHIVAQHNLGRMHYDGEGVKQDHKEALKWFLLAAKQGYALSPFFVAIIYERGKGIEPDYEKALKWYSVAVKQKYTEKHTEKHTWAQRNLGSMYEKGLGIKKKNYKSAAEWYGKASLKDDEEANYALGLMYHEGRGVQRNHLKAYILLKRASNSGRDVGDKLFSEVKHHLTNEQIAKGDSEACVKEN